MGSAIAEAGVVARLGRVGVRPGAAERARVVAVVVRVVVAPGVERRIAAGVIAVAITVGPLIVHFRIAAQRGRVARRLLLGAGPAIEAGAGIGRGGAMAHTDRAPANRALRRDRLGAIPQRGKTPLALTAPHSPLSQFTAFGRAY